MKETIAHAAIRHPSGLVVTGRRHHEIIHAMALSLGERPVRGEQGFVTSTGRFVDRSEAGRIALKSCQVTALRYHVTDLFSEELW